jgi:hypothetical protein
MQIDFSSLEQDFRAWMESHIRQVRETCGEDYAYGEAVELEADPWLALRWYVEDKRTSSST